MKRLPAIALLALLVPATANAATVRVGPALSTHFQTYRGVGVETVLYRAARGERNRLVVAYAGDAQSVTVSDPGAVIDARGSCTSLDPHRARCVGRPGTSGNLQSTEVHLRDRRDRVRTTRPTPFPIGGVNAYGGSGNDVLDGGAGSDELVGGGGRDRLLGGESNDTLVDGDRSGARGKAGPHRDVMNGGAGPFDSVSYRLRTRRVTVDLRSDVAGERGERDVIRNVEGAIGGGGSDRLVGDATENSLSGGPGADVVIGHAGPDGLGGDAGRDRLVGGAGGDGLFPGGGRDSLSCGSGEDLVHQPIPGELMSAHCERVSYSFPEGEGGFLRFAPNPVAISSDSVEFRIPCPEYEQDDGDFKPCSGRIEIRDATGRLLAKGQIPARTEFSEDRVVAQLTARGRKLTARPAGVVATVSLSHEFLGVAWTIRLRR